MSHDDAGLLQRLEVLEAIEAIRVLKARYAQAADELIEDPSPEKIAAMTSLFTEDAVADYGDFGHFEGRAQISGFFTDVVPATASWTRHFMLNPMIEVDGGAATGRWYCMVQAKLRGDGAPAELQPLWVRYRDTYAKTAEGWRFQSLTAIFDTPT